MKIDQRPNGPYKESYQNAKKMTANPSIALSEVAKSSHTVVTPPTRGHRLTNRNVHEFNELGKYRMPLRGFGHLYFDPSIYSTIVIGLLAFRMDDTPMDEFKKQLDDLVCEKVTVARICQSKSRLARNGRNVGGLISSEVTFARIVCMLSTCYLLSQD